MVELECALVSHRKINSHLKHKIQAKHRGKEKLSTVNQFTFQWKYHENIPMNTPYTKLQLSSFLTIFDLFFGFQIFSQLSR